MSNVDVAGGEFIGGTGNGSDGRWMAADGSFGDGGGALSELSVNNMTATTINLMLSLCLQYVSLQSIKINQRERECAPF